eukprot:TRINITY_DN86232_c0_g1_i1.p1 TRINITY_DN86232_c0_g1~~TRINITY_DN86232_c0_g1_i1.p1  ORF type:complete len:144 (-),score=49.68 TRINITY_DN86232_c0_g1_i1:137-568(-)
MGNTSCCSSADVSTAGEHKEAAPNQNPGFTETIAAPAAPPAAAAAAAGPSLGPSSKASGNYFSISVDKSKGDKLGIDIDHADGETMLVEAVNPGLIDDYNQKNSVKVCVNDRIVEVNGKRGDVLQLVEECKQNQVLNMKIKRA